MPGRPDNAFGHLDEFGSGNWDVGSNWSTGQVPGVGDTVIVNTTGAATITIQESDSEAIDSLSTAAKDTLSIVGGSLSFAASSSLSGPLSMSGNGASLTASGTGITVTASGSTSIADASLYASSGATLDLPNLTSYASGGGTFQANGAGSVLSVSALATVTQPDGSWTINDINGGKINLTGFTSLVGSSGIYITDTGGSKLLNNLSRLAGVNATLDGTDTSVANTWTQFTSGSDLTITGGSYTLPKLTDVDQSSLSVYSGGSLTLPNLTNYTAGQGTALSAEGTGSVLNLSALTNTTLSGAWAIQSTFGGEINLTGLSNLLSNDSVSISDFDGGKLLNNFMLLRSVNAYLDGTDASVANTWTAFNNGSLTIAGGSYTLPGLTDVDNSSLKAYGGSLSLPDLTSYSEADNVTFGASGATSVLNLSALDNPVVTSLTWSIAASSGGIVNLSGVTQISLQFYIQIDANGTGSEVNLSALTSLSESVGDGNIAAYSGGEVDLNDLTTLNSPQGFAITDTGSSQLLLKLTNFDNYTVTLDGADASLASGWTHFTDGSFTVSSGSVNLPALTDADNSTFLVEGGGSLTLPDLINSTETQQPLGAVFEATGSGSVLDFSALNSLGAMSGYWPVTAESGGTVEFPALVTIDEPNTDVQLHADGSGSAIDFNALTGLTATGSALFATSGATLNLSKLRTLTAPGTDLESDGSGSVLNISSLTALAGSSSEPSVLEVTTSGIVEDSDLANLTDVTFDLDGTGTLATGQIASISGNFPFYGGGALALSGLTALNNANLQVEYSTLTLPSGINFAGDTFFEATGSAASLTLKSTSLAESTSPGIVMLFQAEEGATLSFPNLTSISGGTVALLSNGSGSTIDLSSLESFTSSGGASAINSGSIECGIGLPAAPDIGIGSSQSAIPWDSSGGWLLGNPPDFGENVIISTPYPGEVDLLAGDDIETGNLVLGSSDTLMAVASAELIVSGTLTNNGVLTLPPQSEISVNGKLIETASATIDEQIDDTPSNDGNGLLAVSGSAALAGTLDLSLTNGYDPSPNADYPAITYSSASGNFSTLTGVSPNFSEKVNASSLDLIAVPIAPSFTADTPPNAVAGASYSYQFEATGTAPITYSASGLPSWLNLSTAGNLTGTPTAAGTFNFKVTASNGINPPATQNITLTAVLDPPAFTADTPPAAIGGSSYTYQFQAVNTGTSAITYTATGLPSWAQLNASTGLLSGTPTADGTFNFKITASNGIAPNTSLNVALVVCAEPNCDRSFSRIKAVWIPSWIAPVSRIVENFGGRRRAGVGRSYDAKEKANRGREWLRRRDHDWLSSPDRFQGGGQETVGDFFLGSRASYRSKSCFRTATAVGKS